MEVETDLAAVVIDREAVSQAAGDPVAGSLEEGVPMAVIDRAAADVQEVVIDLVVVIGQAEARVQVMDGPM